MSNKRRDFKINTKNTREKIPSYFRYKSSVYFMNAVKIRHENTTDRTILGAFLTSCAKRIIDVRKIILDADCARRTVFLTFPTSDTRIRAFRARDRALFLITAGDQNPFLVSHKRNKPLRTGAGTDSASDTRACVYVRNTVLQANRILRTGLDAISKTHTSKAAFFLSAIHRLCRLAAANTDIIHLILGMRAISVATDHGNLLDNALGLLAEYHGNLPRGRIRTWYTKICRNRIVLGKRSCVSVTSGISASTAISARETFTYCRESLILG